MGNEGVRPSALVFEGWRALTENTDDTVLLVDREGTIRFINRPLTPRPPEEIVGTSIFERGAPATLRALRETFDGVQATGETGSFEIEVDMSTYYPGMSSRWFITKLVPVKEDGAFAGALVMISDITDQKRLELRLRESEQRWRSLTNNTDDTVIVIDEARLIRYINRTFPTTSPDDVMGTSIEKYVAPEHHDIMRVSLDRVFTTGESTTYETKLEMAAFRLEGPPKWFVTKVVPIKSGSETTGCILIANDITERKTMELRLRDAEDKWRSLTDNTDDTIQLVDRDGIIRYINRTLPPTKAEDVVGTSIYGWVVPEHSAKIRETLERVLRTGVPDSYETRLDMAALGLDAPALWFTVKVVPTTVDQEVSGAILIATNTTERKRYEDDLRKSKEVAEAANVAKSTFLANMSHEVRTPLNAIIGLTNLALLATPSEKVEDYLVKVRTASRSLLELINDILDFAKIEAGRMTIERVDFDLRSVVEGLHILIGTEVASKNLEWLATVDADVPTALRGDPLRIGQVLTNLVHNAVKFTERGSIAIRVAKESETDSHVRVKFSVQDTGIGIDHDDIERLFESFTQLDGSTTRKFGGSGLGLAICKHLVELMGGEVQVDSEPGRGSTFSFSLDLHRQSSDTTGAPQHRQRSSSPTLSPTRLHGVRVLVVEDIEVNLQIMREVLENVGASVRTATDGLQALQALHEETFDIVLMDVQMPRMDGFEATRTLRTEERFANLPVIAITAHAMDGDRQRCLDAGMNDHLTKPIDSDRLLSTIAEHVGSLRFAPAVPADQREGIVPHSDASLPGFDLPAALALVGGSRTALLEVLRTFAKHHAGCDEQLRTYVQHEEFDQAKRLVHSLIGVTGNLRAVRMLEVAKLLQKNLADRNFDAFEEAFGELRDALAEVISSIEDLEAAEGDQVPPSGNVLERDDLRAVVPLLQNLETLLRDHDVNARSVFEDVHGRLRDARFEDQLRRMQVQLVEFDYADALVTLRALEEHIVGLLEAYAAGPIQRP